MNNLLTLRKANILTPKVMSMIRMIGIWPLMISTVTMTLTGRRLSAKVLMSARRSNGSLRVSLNVTSYLTGTLEISNN